jgi:glucose/arabinose dehydrogenase
MSHQSSSRSRFPFIRLALPAAVLAGALAAVRSPEKPPGPVAALAVAAPDVSLQTLATGLGGITSIVSAGDNRLFLTIQTGRVVVWNGSQVLPAPFLDVTNLVSCCGERGLLSIAFHPRYAENGLFFVDYTNRAGNTVIARYRVSAADPNVADASSGVTLLTINQPFENHNGGELQFGPDGYLYVGMGDGGSANDPMCNAQRDDTLLGKLLRIDVDQNVNSSPFYGIPPDNPFRPAGVPNEVWAKGLRNPWRFSFDRATGDLWIGDVGQDAREEVDVQPAGDPGGRNYGWKVMEGTICGAGGMSGCPSAPPACGAAAYVRPVFEYDHSGGNCSITGGYVYRGAAMPSFAGKYFYGDYCSGRLFANDALLTPRPTSLTTFGQDSAGELYLGTGAGSFFRLAEVGAPVVTATPTPTSPPPPTPTLAPPPVPTAIPPIVGIRMRPTPRVIERN